VHLCGPVIESEADALLATTADIRGAREVTHQLELHDTAAGVPALQGGPDRVRARTHWSPSTRAIGGLAGGVLIIGARRMPRPLGAMARAAGASLALRAATNLDTDELLGVNGAHHVVDVHKAIHIAAPVADVFSFWSHVENFPLFMGHLEEMRRIDELTSHWIATGPLGRRFEWDAEITDFEADHLISWRSLRGGDIANDGTVRFEPSPDGGTRIAVHLRYAPIAGAAGHRFASLLGADPKSAMDDDLVRLKSLLEQGRATAHGHTVSRAEVETGQLSASH
ncbi:MAG: SRPBCC family protein, partial [Longimicrobiales bacterium]